MIYFIQNTGTKAVKIGLSDDPHQRLGQLQTGSNHLLRLLGTVEGDRDVEAALHDRFGTYHVGGEWFRGHDLLDRLAADFGLNVGTRSMTGNGKGLVALTAAEATVTTCTVTIKALKINNRQLTQSTFRQLPVRNLIDEEQVELLGIPWGWVNYSPDKDDDRVQFVAQFGERLCRCPTIDLKTRDYQPSALRRLENRYDAVVFRGVLLSGLAEKREPPKESSPTVLVAREKPFRGSLACKFETDTLYCWRCFFDPKDKTEPIYGPPEGPYQIAHRIGEKMVTPAAEMKLRHLDRFRTAVRDKEKVDPDTDLEACRAERFDILRAAVDYCERWDALIDRLATVEQLFIAT